MSEGGVMGSSLANGERSQRVKARVYMPDVDEFSCSSKPLADLALHNIIAASSLQSRVLKPGYMADLTREGGISPCALMMGLLYIKRLSQNNPSFIRTVSSRDLFLVAMVIASKYMNDEGECEALTNSDWSEIGCRPKSTLDNLERRFLEAIDWRLYVSLEEYYSFVAGVEGRIAFQQAVLRGWWTYADMLAAWEASDLQQTMLSASKQTAKVACGGAALTVVCLATLLATSQSLHVAREVPTNSPAHLTPATRPFDPLDLTTSPFLDHHLLSETQMTGLFPPPLPAFLSPCDTSPNGTDQRDYLSRISVLKNRSALHEQFTAINFLVLAPHANRFRGSHSPLHPDYYQSRQARRRGYLRSKHGFLSTSVRVDPTGHEDRVHSSVGEPDPAQLHSSVGEPDPAQLHSLVGEPDPAQLHSVKSSSRINLCSCCLDRKGISKTAAADMPDVDNSTCRAAVSDIHHKPVVRASEPEISKEEWQESNNSWSETGTALHGILGMSDITLGEQDRRFVDVVGADLGAGCSYREPASTSIPLPPPLSSLPPSSLQPSNTALNASEGLFNYVIFSLLA